MVVSIRSPTILTRNFGFAWGLGGWLLTPFLGTIDPGTFSQIPLARGRGFEDDVRKLLYQ